jgi:hypothetical protein
MLSTAIMVFGGCFTVMVILVAIICLFTPEEEKDVTILDDAAKMRNFMKKYEDYENKKVG